MASPTVNSFLFWVVAAITVLPSLALLFARKAVHVAMAVVLVMIGLAVSYIMLAAPFLGMVQIVVYTGAVMMLFVFVLMLIGVSGKEDLTETLKGQRWIGFLVATGIGLLLTGGDHARDAQRARADRWQSRADLWRACSAAWLSSWRRSALC